MSKKRKTQHKKRSRRDGRVDGGHRGGQSISLSTGVMLASSIGNFDDFVGSCVHHHSKGERGNGWAEFEADAAKDGRTLSVFRNPSDVALSPLAETWLVIVTDRGDGRATTAIMFGSELDYLRGRVDSFADLGQQSTSEPSVSWDHF